MPVELQEQFREMMRAMCGQNLAQITVRQIADMRRCFMAGVVASMNHKPVVSVYAMQWFQSHAAADLTPEEIDFLLEPERSGIPAENN